VRLKDIADSHRRLLRELTRRISKRLEAEFTSLPCADGPNIGIQLREGHRKVVMELPAAVLLRAEGDMTVQEAIRVRIKARRDRMLFRREPISLREHTGAGRRPPSGGVSFGSRQGYGRGRR
jgi:hypothetical protein